MPALTSKNRYPRSNVLIPLSIWLGFTLVSAVFLAVGASHQVALARSAPGYEVVDPTPASPGYLGVVANWDGNWYNLIADRGYPRELPVDSHGSVEQNAWAFYPAYPLTVRGVMAVTGGSFNVSAWAVSLTFGAAAMVALFTFVRPRMGTFGAAALVSGVMAYVTAPILQVAYTEGLAMLLIVLFLAAVDRRRLGLALTVAVALSLTRPIALPLGVVMGVTILRDWLVERRVATSALVPVKGIVVTGAVFLTVGLWPSVAWAVTGRPKAFFETQASWPVNSGGLGGWLGDMVRFTPLGLVGVAVVLYVALVTSRPSARVWGSELRVWSIAYPLYLIVASRPSPSILRYLMLSIAPLWPFPGLGLAYVRDNRWLRAVVLGAVIVVGLGMQYLWVRGVFTVAHDPSQQPFP